MQTRAIRSLAQPGGKVWMDEDEELPGDLPTDLPIGVRRWTRFAATRDGDPIIDYLKLDTCPDIHNPAQFIQDLVHWGSYAPLRKNIRLQGAWTSANGETWLSCKKQTRSLQIGCLGFS